VTDARFFPREPPECGEKHTDGGMMEGGKKSRGAHAEKGPGVGNSRWNLVVRGRGTDRESEEQ